MHLCQEAKNGAPHKTPCLMGIASIACFARGSANNSLFYTSDLTLKMTSGQKTFNIKVVRLVETVKIAFGPVSIRGRLPPQNLPARCSQFKPNDFGEFEQKQSEFH